MTRTVILFLAIVPAVMISAQEQKAFTGVVSDSMCFSKHMLKDMGAANEPDCVRMCRKEHFDYVLLTGKEEKDYVILKGKTEDFDKYVAQKVTVKGTLHGDTLTAESVAPAKDAPRKPTPRHKSKKAAP